MAFHRLIWRVGVPFVLLLLLQLLVLAVTMSRQIEADERRSFEQFAAQNRAFIDHASLKTSERLAEDLNRVTGHMIFFRWSDSIVPAPRPPFDTLPLSTVAADGHAVRHGDHELVALPIESKRDLVVVRDVHDWFLDASVWPLLGAFVLLSTVAAWFVVGALVRPLRHLASQLPGIERPGPIELPAAARHDEIGDLARAFLRTRTALHDAQDSRQRMEKLAVLGRMTAALAHEVQNPVAAIRIHAQLWREATDHPSALTIEREAARIEGMLNQWLYLTRPEPPAVADVDVGALLADVVQMHQNQAEHAAVAVELDVGPGLVVAADGRRLDQVFRNLLTNALQAMPGGGGLRITARAAGDLVRIEFRDRGPGFSSVALERFAEFFFSEREGGMGIGLSVASEIVRAHGGKLSAANQPTGGATVTVELPVAQPGPSGEGSTT